MMTAHPLRKNLLCTACWDQSAHEESAVAYAFGEGLCEDHAALLAAGLRRMWAEVAMNRAVTESFVN